MPSGAITGYPGVLAYKMRSGPFNRYNRTRVEEWRAMRCDGQVPIGHVVRRLAEAAEEIDDRKRAQRKTLCPALFRLVKSVANGMGIDRCYVARSGKHHIVFNAGEARAVYLAALPEAMNVLDDPSWRSLYRMFGYQGEAVEPITPLAKRVCAARQTNCHILKSRTTSATGRGHPLLRSRQNV